jgi:hypothetical protein
MPALQTISPDAISAADSEIRADYPDWVGLMHPDAQGQIRAKGAGGLRTKIFDVLSGKRYEHAGFLRSQDLMDAIDHPAAYGYGTTGATMFAPIDGRRIAVPGDDHFTYTHGIPGEYVGGLPEEVPAQAFWPDALANAGNLPNGTTVQKLRSMFMNHEAQQPLDDNWLRGMNAQLGIK